MMGNTQEIPLIPTSGAWKAQATMGHRKAEKILGPHGNTPAFCASTPQRVIWVRLMLGMALIFYLVAGTYQLDLPGLNFDEALDAVPAMQIVLGQPLDNYAILRLAGREWPFMVMPYVGCTTTYWLVPVFGLFGVSTISLRSANVVLGLITLLLIWVFLREFLDERAAALSTLLLAVNPSYIFWTRIGAYVSLPMLPLAVLALWCLFRWYIGQGDGYLVSAFFCLGLGLSTKVLFAWFWVALGLGWLVLSGFCGQPRSAGWRAWLWPWQHTGWPTWLWAVLALLLGSAMLIIYNLQGLGTLRLILRNLTSTELYGVSNLNVLANLRTVILDDLRMLLDGSWFGTNLGGPHRNALGVPALAFAIVVLAWLYGRRKIEQRTYFPRRLALLGILGASIVVQSAFTISSLGANHLVIVWPVPQALVAAALWNLADQLRGRTVACVPIALGIILVAAEAWTTLQYHRTLAQTGGLGPSSDAIYALARDLQHSDTPMPVLLDWGFRRNLQLLTQGRLRMDERYDYSQRPGEDFARWIDRRVTESPAIYIFHSPQHTAFGGHWEVFEEAAYRHRLIPVLWRSYTQRDGTPVYLAYRLEPTPRLNKLPANARPLDVRLGDGIALLGYELANETAKTGGDLRLTLYWQALTRPLQSYKVFVHLLDQAGVLRAQYDGEPVLWAYPTHLWEVGEIVPDRVRIALIGADAKPLPVSSYRVMVGMYDEKTGHRLPLVHNGERQRNDALALVTLTLEP